MIDHHRLIDDIRSFLGSRDQTRSERLTGLARQYAEACAEANERLSRCGQLLLRGLRSEAIHLAEAEPRLLDVVALLDFPERDDWRGLVELYELPEAHELNLGTADALCAAYAEADPLQGLLRQHRRLALARAPLDGRIRVLRQIARQDAVNSIWADDLREYEKARLRQVRDEAGDALTRHDLPRLQALNEELASAGWTQRPPAALVEGVRQAVQTLRRDAARRTLGEIEPALNEAFGAFDLPAGRALRVRWLAQVKEAALPPGDPLRDRAEPALAWLDEADRREAEGRAHADAVAALERALDDGADRVELERLAHAVARIERGLPDATAHRLRSRMAADDLATSRRSRLVLVGVAGGLALTAAVTFTLVRQHQRDRAVAEAVAAIDAAIGEDRLVEALNLHDRFARAEAALAAAPALLAARNRIEAARSQEADRARRFAETLARLDGVDPVQERPAELQAARELARGDADRAALEGVLQARAARRAEERRRRDDAATPRLDALAATIKRAEQAAAAAAPTAEVEAEVRRVLAELAALEPDVARASPQVRALHRLHGSRLTAVREALLRRKQEAGAEVALATAVGSIQDGAEPYAKAIESYLAAAPGSPRAEAFRRSLGERPLWDAALAWGQQAAEWTAEPLPRDPAKARERAALVARFLADHPASPDAERLAAYRAALEAMGRREGENSLRDDVLTLCGDILVDQLYLVEMREGTDRVRPYYTTERLGPQGPADGRFEYLVGFDGRTRERTFVKPQVKYVGLSPQSRLVASFKKSLFDDPTLAGWDTLMLGLARGFAEDPEIDPLLKLRFVEEVLKLGAEGSVPLREAITPTRQAIARIGVDRGIAWMDPDDPFAADQRPRAAEGLAQLPPWGEVLRQVQAARERIEAVVRERRTPAGWLARGAGSGGAWECRLAGSPPSRDGLLWAVVPGPPPSAAWAAIGKVQAGRVVLAPARAADVAEGRLVFYSEGTITP
jgi:hypothetical protein